MKTKFIEAVEIVKPGKHSYRYIGIELQRTKETVSLLAVQSSNYDDIDIHELDLKMYKFKESTKEKVHHFFTQALKSTQVAFIESEKDLLRVKRDLEFHQNKIKQFFGKPIEVKPSENVMEF